MRGASPVLVTMLTLGGLALVLGFLYQVYYYYRAIRAGERVELPQFGSSFSSSPSIGAAAVPSGDVPGLETADDPALGPEAPLLTVVEFVDYECPFCRESSGIVRTLAAEYGDRVRFVIRDFPIEELHENALRAAEAAGCAEAQGAYWQMHDRMFAKGAPLTRAILDNLAVQSGLDMERYASCMNAHERRREIEEDLVAGGLAGVRGTPTFFFNGRRVEGSIPEASFRAVLDAFLNVK